MWGVNSAANTSPLPRSSTTAQAEMRDSASPARSHGCTQRSCTLSRVSLNSSSMPSLSSLALSLAVNQPVTHHSHTSHSLELPSPPHAVSVVNQLQRVNLLQRASASMLPAGSHEQGGRGSTLGESPPPQQPRTFPPFLDTPLWQNAWQQRNSCSTQATTLILQPRVLSLQHLTLPHSPAIFQDASPSLLLRQL
jgi:hypothetical protein